MNYMSLELGKNNCGKILVYSCTYIRKPPGSMKWMKLF